MKSVNHFKLLALMFSASLVALTLPFGAIAQQADQKTIVTFSEPIEIPGVGQQYLPAGKYVFKLVDSLSSRNIVQIFNEDESHVFATILTISDYRLKPTDKTVMTFRERAAGQPEAIRAWFYPGAIWGQEFVYPKARAVQLAELTDEPVLFIPSELAVEIIQPVQSLDDPSVVALKKAPIMAVTPKGEEVEVAQVVEPQPAQTASTSAQTPSPSAETESTPAQTASTPAETPSAPVQTASTRLPQTASTLPFFGLIGLLSLGAGFALSVSFKRTA